jgi:hypothetical protein
MRIEIRECIKCGEIGEIPQPKDHTSNVCKECRNKAARIYAERRAEQKGQRKGMMGRLPYPLEGKWAYPLQKFQSINKVFKKLHFRHEWIEQIRINLEITLNNKEVMDWINAHKDEAPLKRQKKIERDYPDTTKMTWDEWEKGGWGDEVDS